jgi:mRNA interferase RelE/StbE
MYKIVYRKSAAKALMKLPSTIVTQFRLSFDQLAQGQTSNLDLKKLQGRDGYRLRLGAYRAIYQIVNEQMIIEIIKIGSRGDIYK